MAAAPQQGNQSDNSAAILWWVAAIFAGVGAIWYGFKDYIVVGYLSMKLYEVDILTWLGTHLNFNVYAFEQIQSAILYARANPSHLKFNELLGIGTAVGDWLRFPLMILMFGLAIWVYFANTTRVFRHNYSMRDLAKLEKGNWPQINPVVDLDLINVDIDSGPWAMALTPLQFCKRYRLLDEFRPQRQEGMSRRDWDRIDVVLKRGEANKLFALQLGALWQGVNRLPPHARALFAVFAARLNADTKPATQLLEQLNQSAKSQLDMTGVDELIKKHENTKGVKRITQNHAYVLTVMASMLEGAREDGVQASADFLWLKPLDRRLWYMLNTVGRQTPFIEVGGAFAHWVAEKEAGRKLLVPMVEEATNAVEIALKEVVYHPDEQAVDEPQP